jgi:hypothetical protein
MVKGWKRLIAASGLLCLFSTSGQAAVAVGVELYLLVDTSGSIYADEFLLQKQGYVDAFRSPEVKAAIAANPTGSIAATLIYWAGPKHQALGVGWTRITSDTADDFADLIAATARPNFGRFAQTAPQDVLTAIVTNPLFDYRVNDFTSAKQVVDISGDGPRNAGLTGTAGRDAAIAAGIDVINGLAILDDPEVLPYYQQFVIYGGGQVFVANDFDDFGAVLLTKITREIGPDVTPVPLPAGAWLLATGLATLILARRRRSR